MRDGVGEREGEGGGRVAWESMSGRSWEEGRESVMILEQGWGEVRYR